MSKPTISAAINTYNEERDLPFALRSISSWVDEIIVVDMHSTDRTREIAKEFGAKVFLHENVGFADPARAFALSKCKGEWILILDADEMIPKPLSDWLLNAAENNRGDVFRISRENYFFGEIMRHTRTGR